MNIVLLGAPASGKGTQSQNMINEFNFFHISTGDIVRNNINGQTEYGIQASKYLRKGELVPYSLIINMLNDFLDKNKNQDKIIWDGFPRTVEQAKALDQLLEVRKQKVDLVFYLKIKPELAIERITSRVVCPKCKRSYNTKFHQPKIEGRCDFDNEFLVKRSDDDVNKFTTRLKIYEKEINLLTKYYQDKLVEVNSNLNKDIVWKNIKEKINDKY